MELQHINVKIYTRNNAFDLEKLIPVFHDWIREKSIPDELLIDVADYSHVPAGPGVMLVGHDAFYSLEPGPEDRLGLLFNQRLPVAGTNQERLLDALRRAANACRMLTTDSRLSGLEFLPGDLRIFANDRALVPNKKQSFAELESDLKAALGQFFGAGDMSVEYLEQDARERFTVTVKAASAKSLPTA